jgi:GR25 family glycosyltransferase involved in LPS biosynthesis
MYYSLIIIVLICVSIYFLFFYKKPQPKKEPFKTTDYLDGIDVIYWINLDRSVDRRQRMEKMFEDPVFAQKKIIRISAVDGKAHDIDQILNTNFEGMQPDKFTKVEYACLLSHLNAIKQFSESNNKTALIMEDDMTLEYKPYWKKSVQQIIDNAPNDWELIQLCININSPLKQIYTKNSNGHVSCNGAYVINKNGSLKLNENKYKLGDTLHVADVYIFNKISTYAYKYPMFTYKFNQTSTIHQEHLEQHDRNKKIIDNFIKGKT